MFHAGQLWFIGPSQGLSPCLTTNGPYGPPPSPNSANRKTPASAIPSSISSGTPGPNASKHGSTGNLARAAAAPSVKGGLTPGFLMSSIPLNRLFTNLERGANFTPSIRNPRESVRDRLSFYTKLVLEDGDKMVGAVRFELTTSCTPSKRAYQATLRPEPFRRISGREITMPPTIPLHNLKIPPRRGS